MRRQRIGAGTLGYENLNDHDALRFDPAHALMVGKQDVEGQDQFHPRDPHSLTPQGWQPRAQ